MPKSKNNKKPVENQETAAWANIEQLKAESSVPIPSESEMTNAKNWVDTNQK